MGSEKGAAVINFALEDLRLIQIFDVGSFCGMRRKGLLQMLINSAADPNVVGGRPACVNSISLAEK